VAAGVLCSSPVSRDWVSQGLARGLGHRGKPAQHSSSLAWKGKGGDHREGGGSPRHTARCASVVEWKVLAARSEILLCVG
jgi:hypothetical protein